MVFGFIFIFSTIERVFEIFVGFVREPTLDDSIQIILYRIQKNNRTLGIPLTSPIYKVQKFFCKH